MADVLKSLDFEYVAANPGSSFRGLHESFINYGGNKSPELLTCCHEESSVAMAHGYAKIEGKPMLVMAHGTVGLQHASMAIYNAYADRVPVYIVLGNIADAGWRRSDVEWTHSVQDAAAMVRDYTKWDDMPASLGHFAESGVRAYKIAMTPPYGPVVIVADAVLQEEGIAGCGARTPARAEALADLAARRRRRRDRRAGEACSSPPRARRSSPAAWRARRQAWRASPSSPSCCRRRCTTASSCCAMNFPTRHPLKRRRHAVADADFILGLENRTSSWPRIACTPVNRFGMEARRVTKPGAKIVTISSQDLRRGTTTRTVAATTRSTSRLPADAEATLPALVEACGASSRRSASARSKQRGAKLAEASRQRARDDARRGRLGMGREPDFDRAAVGRAVGSDQATKTGRSCPTRRSSATGRCSMWDFTKHHQFIGWSGAYGIGYGAPAAVGAALANRKHGRLSVNIQCDGDLNYAPAVLWTAAHHRIPLLTVMHNNRAYHQERMYVTDMAARANRDVSRAHIGNELERSGDRLRDARQGLRRLRPGSDRQSQRSRARDQEERSRS